MCAPGQSGYWVMRNASRRSLSRRYAAAGTEADLLTCARLLAMAPGSSEADLVLRGMEKALEGRQLTSMPSGLQTQLSGLWDNKQPSVTLIRLGLRLKHAQAY